MPYMSKDYNNPSDSSYWTIKKFVESFEINSFIYKTCLFLCYCENSLFIGPEHGQILTGDQLTVHNNNSEA